jgi:hypothetical protein
VVHIVTAVLCRANLGVNLEVSNLFVPEGASTYHSGSQNLQLKRIAMFPSLDTQAKEHCSGLGQHSCMMKPTFFVFVLPCPSTCFSLVRLYQTHPTKKKKKEEARLLQFLQSYGPGLDHRDIGFEFRSEHGCTSAKFCVLPEGSTTL